MFKTGNRLRTYVALVCASIGVVVAGAPVKANCIGVLLTHEDGVVVVKDACVKYKASHEFLYELRHTLRKLPAGKHFDKNGNRVCPPRPGNGDRPHWV